MKKKYFALFLVFLLFFSLSGCKSQEEKQAEQAKKNWEQTSYEEKMGIYCALIKEYMLLVEDFGEDTPYPAMRRSVKGSMMSNGMTLEEALAQAEQVLLEEQAVFWYADQENIQVSAEAVKDYIEENVLKELKASETYEQVDGFCQEEGITFEDTIWAYENSYKMECIAKAAGVEDAESYAAFKEAAVDAYKSSDAYMEFQRVVENCRSLIEEDITDKDAICKADIYW